MKLRGADAVELNEQVEVLMEKLRSIETRSAAQEEMLISMKQALETKEEKQKTWEVMDGDDASCKIQNALSRMMMNAERTTQAALIAFD